MVDHLNQFGGYAADDGVGRYILGDDSPCGDDSIVANRHALQHRDVSTKPHFVAYTDRSGSHTGALTRIGQVVERAERGIVPDERIIADEDTPLVLKLTAHVDEHPFADMGVLATVGVERREHTKRLGYPDSPQLAEQLSQLLGRVVRAIDLGGYTQGLLRKFVKLKVQI